MKILINKKHGGFGISDEAFEEYLRRTGVVFYKWYNQFKMSTYTTVPKEEYDRIEQEDSTLPIGIQKDGSPNRYQRINSVYLTSSDIPRDDPILVKIVEEMGDKANGHYARLAIVEIPDDVKWQIEEYDGLEWIAEKHRTWS